MNLKKFNACCFYIVIILPLFYFFSADESLTIQIFLFLGRLWRHHSLVDQINQCPNKPTSTVLISNMKIENVKLLPHFKLSSFGIAFFFPPPFSKHGFQTYKFLVHRFSFLTISVISCYFLLLIDVEFSLCLLQIKLVHVIRLN